MVEIACDGHRLPCHSSNDWSYSSYTIALSKSLRMGFMSLGLRRQVGSSSDASQFEISGCDKSHTRSRPNCISKRLLWEGLRKMWYFARVSASQIADMRAHIHIYTYMYTYIWFPNILRHTIQHVYKHETVWGLPPR